MKQHAIHIAKTQKEADRLQEEISNLETELSATGSAKTADEVHVVLDVLSGDMYDLLCVSPNSHRWMIPSVRRTNDREKQSLVTERERQTNAQRTFENDLHELQMRESNLANKLRDKDTLQANIEIMKTDIISFIARLKVDNSFRSLSKMCHNWKLPQELDAKIDTAQGPIDRLEQDHKDVQRELNNKITEAQRLSQDLNMNVDKLDGMNKAVERYDLVPSFCINSLTDLY